MKEKAGFCCQLDLYREKLASVFAFAKNYNFDSAKIFNELKIYIF